MKFVTHRSPGDTDLGGGGGRGSQVHWGSFLYCWDGRGRDGIWSCLCVTTDTSSSIHAVACPHSCSSEHTISGRLQPNGDNSFCTAPALVSLLS